MSLHTVYPVTFWLEVTPRPVRYAQPGVVDRRGNNVLNCDLLFCYQSRCFQGSGVSTSFHLIHRDGQAEQKQHCHVCGILLNLHGWMFRLDAATRVIQVISSLDWNKPSAAVMVTFVEDVESRHEGFCYFREPGESEKKAEVHLTAARFLPIKDSDYR